MFYNLFDFEYATAGESVEFNMDTSACYHTAGTTVTALTYYPKYNICPSMTAGKYWRPSFADGGNTNLSVTDKGYNNYNLNFYDGSTSTTVFVDWRNDLRCFCNIADAAN